MPGNLPAKQKQGSTLSLQERERNDHREWIAGRALTLLSHYWRDDDPIELTAALGRDWADVLADIPQEYIQRACIEFQREEPKRRPTPGAIYQRARLMMLRERTSKRPLERLETQEERAAYLESARRDRVDPKRQAEAEAILAGFRKKRDTEKTVAEDMLGILDPDSK